MKHWLLNLAIKHPIGLLRFLPAVKSEWLNVLPIPGCTAEDYASGLLSLLESEMIELFTHESGDERVIHKAELSELLDRYVQLPEPEPRPSTNHRDLTTQQRDPVWADPAFRHLFRLTPSGGEAWASAAEPAWEKFCDQLSDYDDGELTSSNRDLLIASMGWFVELTSDSAVKAGTIKFETHANYPVLYWKTLPHVYRATFEVEPAEPQWSGGYVAEPEWFREWRFAPWYKHPWELPGWPQ